MTRRYQSMRDKAPTPLRDDPALSTIINDLEEVFSLAEQMTGSMRPAECAHTRKKIARAKKHTLKVLRAAAKEC